MIELTIGVMGFGGMGHYHVEHVDIPGVRFVAACDIQAIQIEDADTYGLKSYLNDEEGFFNDPDFNTVLITLPNHLHKEYAIKAAKAKKNIICEKPAALNPQEFDEMVEAAEENGVLFTVHQNRRWDKDFAIVKEVYDKNLVGSVFNIESNLHMPSGRIHNWHQFKEYGGGMVYDWAVHCIDQALQLIPQKIDHIYADLKNVFHSAVDDYYKIIIKFRNGESITLNQSTYVLKPYPRWLICGTKGTCEVRDFSGQGKIYSTTRLVEHLPPKIEPNIAGPTRSFVAVPPGEMLEKELPRVEVSWLDFYRNYLNVINGKEKFVIENAEVRRVLQVMMACFESAEKGKTVKFSYDD